MRKTIQPLVGTEPKEEVTVKVHMSLDCYEVEATMMCDDELYLTATVSVRP